MFRKLMIMFLTLIFLALPQVSQSQDNSDVPGIEDVETWFYYLDVNLDDDTLTQIVASDYDMVVIDFIPSEANNTDYPMADLVTALHTAEHPKLVIAYIDTGQAEDYRSYWQPEWQIGDPEWIVATDPDGWDGNYPVAYWFDAYREIWLGEDGLLNAIVTTGFDGIYLDWVEAYSDEDVMAFAETDGVDPIQEMIWWVDDMAAHTRAQNPKFLVIAQNASELAYYPEYMEIIDAIAQEQVWFDGGADNEPPGDCPLPATEADIESDAYVASLSDECRRVYEEYPDSTLHVSSEGYIEDLVYAKEQGLVIFTVDYALQSENIEWVYAISRSYGFVPFVGNRNLDRFIPPYELE